MVSYDSMTFKNVKHKHFNVLASGSVFGMIVEGKASGSNSGSPAFLRAFKAFASAASALLAFSSTSKFEPSLSDSDASPASCPSGEQKRYVVT